MTDLLIDRDLLAEAESDPGGLALRYGLPESAVRQLRPEDAPGMRMTAAITRHKAFNVATEALPATMALCRQTWDEDTIYRRVLARASMATPTDRAEAGRRLGQLASEPRTGAEREIAQAVARYEVLRLEVRARPGARRRPGAQGPSLGAEVVLAAFTCQVTDVHKRLLAGGPYDKFSHIPTYYLLTPGVGDSVRVHRLPAALHGLLELCDGALPLAELAVRRGLTTEAVERALTSLRAKGVELTW